MEWLDDKEVEFDRLHNGLVMADVDACATHWHAGRSRLDGSSRLAHLYTVGQAASRYAQWYYCDQLLYTQRYWQTVCQAAGLLHESMDVGHCFEEVIQAADEAVAVLIAALTPDWRDPIPKRLPIYINRIGLAPAPAQVVKFADLEDELAFYTQFAANVKKARVHKLAIQDWLHEAREVVAVMGKIQESPFLAGRLSTLKEGIIKLEQFCRRNFRGE